MTGAAQIRQNPAGPGQKKWQQDIRQSHKSKKNNNKKTGNHTKLFIKNKKTPQKYKTTSKKYKNKKENCAAVKLTGRGFAAKM